MRLPPEQLWTVYVALREIGDWDRARFAAERMLEGISDQSDYPGRHRLRMAAQTLLAESLARNPTDKADLVTAEHLNAEALATARDLARELDTPEARRDVSVSLNNVANAARARGDLAAAERLFGESLEIRRHLARELDTPEARRDVYVSLVLTAELRASYADLSGARALLVEGLAVMHDLQAHSAEAEVSRDIAVGEMRLAGIAAAEGDAPAARAALERAQSAAQRFGQQQPVSDAAEILRAVDEALAQLAADPEPPA